MKKWIKILALLHMECELTAINGTDCEATNAYEALCAAEIACEKEIGKDAFRKVSFEAHKAANWYQFSR